MTMVMVVGLLATTSVFAAETTTPFRGKETDRGTVVHEVKGGQHVLSMSPDFKLPGTPDPHWRVVDSQGKVYLLDRVMLHEGKVNRSITLPAHIADVTRVQMWCAWAEILLGEGSFEKPIALR